jgi:RNA polymerase sporulation-specific sigma factor
VLLPPTLLSALSGLFQARLGIESTQKFPPPLSSEEEKTLFETYAATADEDARQKLILHNLRLVSHIVRKYYSSGNQSSEDLVSIGSIGLVKAVDTFRPDTGTRFATYAAKCIQKAIRAKRRPHSRPPFSYA